MENTVANKRIAGIGSVIIFILLLPVVAMQFSDQVNWNLADFLIAGVLLFGTGFLFELAMRKFTNPVYRIIATLIILATFLIWAELAVGVFGTPWAGS